MYRNHKCRWYFLLRIKDFNTANLNPTAADNDVNVQESSLRPTERASLLPVLARPPISGCIVTALELLNRSSGQVSIWH